MQWDNGVNKGFSAAAKESLYLPVDESADAPTVEAALQDTDSLLHVVRDIFALRRDGSDFDADSAFSVLLGEKDKPFIYTRGEAVCAVNPSDKDMTVVLEQLKGKAVSYVIGRAEYTGDQLQLKAGSFAILK